MSGENPWLGIPPQDYEGHMGSAGVGQLAELAALFAEACRRLRPAGIALLGCATGNGLEVVDPAVTRRLTAVDLSPAYLELARRRHPRPAAATEWICADIRELELEAGGYNLVHAGLLYEYLEPELLLPRVSAWLAPGGTHQVVLQLPGAAEVSASPYPALRRLKSVMRLIPAERFITLAEEAGLRLERERETPLPQGKRFWCGEFRRSQP